MVVGNSPPLLLTHDPLQVFSCHFQQAAQLMDTLVGDVSRGVRCDRLVQQFLGLLVVGPRYIQRVFQRGLVFQG